MKKTVKAIFIISLIFLTACGKVTEYEARQALHNHLIERYGEEFEIGYMGLRSLDTEVWFQGEIYPAKYKGTPRENDKYYHRTGTVDIKESVFGEKISFVGDVYSKVLLNESANEFYLPKLKELFGENVLPIFDIKVSKMAVKPDFYTTYKNRKSEGKKVIISGGIYIFGRVENDEDREKYREEIYKFLSFMKETGTFEYVSLGINIADERCLTDYFKKNIDNLLKAKEIYKTSSEFIAYRDKIFKEAEKEFEQMSKEEKQKRISEFNKSSLLESDIDGYGVIYHAGILSPKFKDSEPRAQSKRKEYNDIKDVELLNTMKILYIEYYRKEDGEIVEK